LIETLGITEEEYFAFRKAQQEYKDPKAGTIFDTRNGLEVSTIALILSIAGTVASVAGALLAPRPEAQEAGGGDRRARDRRFAPRLGFDSLQELSQYGSPVNLIYANQGASSDENPNGGARASTSLLWSAVYSFGNTQYLQMLGALGAGEIVDVDYDLTAVGQTLIRAFRGGSNAPRGIASVWQYFRNSGPILKSDLKNGSPEDPLLIGTASSTTVYDAVIDPTVRRQGFSQAFSPSSTSEFGISSPVPIKVNIYARRDDGSVNKRPVKINVEPRGAFWPDFYGASRPQFPVGYQLTATIASVVDRRNEAESDDLADEIRNAAAESFDPSALYKLGSATFRVFSISGDAELVKGPLSVTLECVESGCGPYEDYETEDVQEEEEELNNQVKEIKRNLDPTIPGTLAFNAANLDIASFLPVGLPEKQARLFDRIRDASDEAEDLYEIIISFRRNIRQIDELVLENASSFDPVVVAFANEIDRIEQDQERLRNRREELNANIERLGFTPQRGDRRRELNAEIADNKKELKQLRAKFSKAIEEFGVADGVVESQVNDAKRLIANIQNTLRAEGLPALANIRTPQYFDSFPSNPKARFERRALRKLVVFFSDLSTRLAAAFQIDTAAFEREKARLNELLRLERIRLANIEAKLSDPQSFNDYLGVKGLVRINEARYETLSPCNLIHFSIKAKVFLRVQGRASRYGETNVKRFRDSDNGNKFRTAMFFVSYKKVGQSDSAFKSPNVIFCVRRSFDRDIFIPLVFRSPDSDGQAKWEFKFTPVYDAPSEAVKRGTTLNFVYLEARGSYQPIPGEPFFYKGYTRSPGITNLPPKNKTPRDVDEWTVFSVRSDTVLQFSFDNGPEFNIVAVSEQQFESLASFPSLYRDIATLGLNAYSGVGLTSMRNLSAFVRKGKKVRKIRLSPPSYPSSPDGPSCWAPDIFLDTILDQDNGIRAFVDVNNAENIDINQLALSKAFCIKQRYFMDGVIADQRPWREFWSEVAPYSLLELAKIGGKETLIPAVPTLADGTITRNITISALFNQGNIIEDTYREEFIDYGEATQDLIASVIYREQSTTEPFPRSRSVTIKIKGVNEQIATRRSFDLSSFVTNRTQAINYGMLLVQQRRNVRRAVEFKTFPTEAPVAPGSYIYVQMEDNQWDNIRSGAVMEDGSLNIPFANETVNGSFDTLIYTPGQAVRRQTISYTDGQSSALAALGGTGTLFVLGTQITSKRVFRVMEVAMEEEGEVNIRAMEYPCAEEGGQTKSLIARFDEGLYDIS
jgi:hypothetical protein